jgi:hypothetical protein
MPFNGAGVYTAPAADAPVVTGTTISSVAFNDLVSDLSTALSTCLLKDGQQVATGNQNLGGFRVTNAGFTGINGTVGIPAINVGDSSSGIYRPALNQIGISINGVQVGLFSSTGLIVNGINVTQGAAGGYLTPQFFPTF